MATKKRLSLIYKIENFSITLLGKVTKFQGNGLLRFGVLSHLLARGGKHPPPPPPPRAYRVKVDCQSIIRLNNKINPYDFEELVH